MSLDNRSAAMASGKNQKTIPPRKKAYAKFIFEPLHISVGALELPVENLTISQNFSPNYNTEEAYGRMDPITTYKNTTRKLNIQFSCQSHQIFDGERGVVSNIHQVNVLTQFLYPSYEDIGAADQLAILKAPPFFRITYGNYIGSFNELGSILGNDSGITGFITNFSHQLGPVARNVAHGRWMSRTPEGKNFPEPIRALPREIKISFNFTVVHDKSVGWTKVGGNYIFSHQGYGGNFPYNVGNFQVQEAAMEQTAAYLAAEKNAATQDSWWSSDKAKAKSATDTKKAVEKAESSQGALQQVSQAQADAAVGLGAKEFLKTQTSWGKSSTPSGWE